MMFMIDNLVAQSACCYSHDQVVADFACHQGWATVEHVCTFAVLYLNKADCR